MSPQTKRRLRVIGQSPGVANLEMQIANTQPLATWSVAKAYVPSTKPPHPNLLSQYRGEGTFTTPSRGLGLPESRLKARRGCWLRRVTEARGD